MNETAFQFFDIQVEAGVALVTFERPPVNAFSYEVYQEIVAVAAMIDAADDIRAAVLAGSPKSRAWIGGADLKDLLGLDPESRLSRYDLINQSLPRFYNIGVPVIAAITGPAVGVGVSVACLSDIRIVSRTAFLAKPEIDRGVVASGGVQMLRLNIPAGIVREMIYTGRRFGAEELAPTGFFNYVVDPEQVVPKAMEVARVIASKSLPALRANKICNNAVEDLAWQEGYKLTQQYSAKLTAGADYKEAIRAFLDHRDPEYVSR